MTGKRIFYKGCLLLLILITSILAACKRKEIQSIAKEPLLFPDISGITVPVNIASINFDIIEQASLYYIDAVSSNGYHYNTRNHNGKVRFTSSAWRKLIDNRPGGIIRIEISALKEDNTIYKFDPVIINIADSTDQYLCYRLLYPGYETYYEMKIVQRDVSTFKESSVVENQLINHNCINCHSFSGNNPGRAMIHARGNMGGTYFIEGNKITKAEFKSDSLPFGAVYPAWRRDGKFVVFSTNNIRQSFHARNDMNIEVTDLNSSLVLYNVETNTIGKIRETDSARYMDTFPEWSPDGSYIYFCRAKQYKEGDDIGAIHYNLVRKPFSEALGSFGPAEIIFDAAKIGKSVSFPRISPDGKYLVFTLHNYGNFSIWHKEADLYVYDIQQNNSIKLTLNSDEAESWHCWSSNSKWLIFSSKRDDGITARPYMAYMGSVNHPGKPFILPQRDPEVYRRMMLTFNRPEFVTGKIMIGPLDFSEAASETACKPSWK